MKRIEFYDTTLRDGMQGVGSHFTIEDKLRIAKLLDDMGIAYIEGGSPGFNAKDAAFFRKMREGTLSNAKLVAFGSTCRVDCAAEEDPGLRALAEAGTEYVCIYGKTWDFHVTDILGTTLEKNLSIIKDSICFLRSCGKSVFFDAEHFFDGYKANRDYALETIKTAESAGACNITLCDTNGGTVTTELISVLRDPALHVSPACTLGIHAHNDSGMAAANSAAAVSCGATLVQGTLRGLGERCGNADLFTVIPAVQLKLGYDCLPAASMRRMTDYYYQLTDILNMKPFAKAPFVGRDAFSHKGGTHIDGVIKNSASFEHVPPEAVGGVRRTVLSELSGRAAVTEKVEKLMPSVKLNSDEMRKIVEKLKEMESEGYQYEGADASFELLVRRLLGIHKSFFKLRNYKVITSDQLPGGAETASAIVDVWVGDAEEVTAANGMGPVDALDSALRKALERFFPALGNMRLIDYKVRVLDSKRATASKVRVLIESSDGTSDWITVGVSEDIIQASWNALVDAHEYLLSKL